MRWVDEGIVLAARRHGESGLIVHLLTRDHGRHAGLVRRGQSPKLRRIYEIGNRVDVAWSARLAEHLGAVVGELLRGHAARFLDDPGRLACLAAIAAVADAALPEREPHQRAYEGMAALLDSLDANESWAPGYVAWELALLAELGFGLDLTHCAATGDTSDLVYVSPKSGHAVSAEAGEPYRDRLLPLPQFLLPGTLAAPTPRDTLEGLALTGYFLDRRVLAPHGRKLPSARSRFVDLLERMATLAVGEAS